MINKSLFFLNHFFFFYIFYGKKKNLFFLDIGYWLIEFSMLYII